MELQRRLLFAHSRENPCLETEVGENSPLFALAKHLQECPESRVFWKIHDGRHRWQTISNQLLEAGRRFIEQIGEKTPQELHDLLTHFETHKFFSVS